MSEQRRYLAYLLRLWQDSAGHTSCGEHPPADRAQCSRPLWRASLESPRSGERRGFASLDELFAFLEKEIGQGDPDPEAPDGG